MCLGSTPARAEKPAPALFARDNLIAWCIVPFDSRKRGPEERAAMLERLGFRHFAYDFRQAHVPTFDAEIEACQRHGVSLDAWWFPGSLNDDARHILEVCRRHAIRPQLWVSGGGGATSTPDEQHRRASQEADRIRPIAEAAAAQGMKVGLYNHGGWFGEPENQLAILEALKLPNVGIVYNFHHGHDHIDRLPEILKKLRPHLLAVNLNGMDRGGDREGRKILQLGQGALDLALLRAVRDSGYTGPIGILGHTQDDAEARLQDNLDGLDWLVAQLDGAPPAPRPQPRTPVPARTPKQAAGDGGKPSSAGGYLVAGRAEYRSPPLAVRVRAALRSKRGYNILVASDTKASAAHWELFSNAGTGHLTVYVPGMTPNHVRSTVDVCDGRPHDLVMFYEPRRIQLTVDGRTVADQAVEPRGGEAKPGELAVGRLVEGTLGCEGTIESVQIARGEAVLGDWQFVPAAAPLVPDRSPLQNPARLSSAAVSAPRAQPVPAPGPHLASSEGHLKVTLIDRSPDEAYMGVRVDRDGCVFVGGREAVYVFEPLSAGGYAPRRELLRFPPESIIIGLEFRGDDLYVLASNALYLVPDGRVQRRGLAPRRILWGLPLDLHVSFHCLAWGPEGDLYLTHGDPVLGYGEWSRPDHWGHWTLYCGAKNEPFSYTGQGAVLAIRPDGTRPRVIATGLRGPVGLAFDRAWNLFTNDNDHESRADQYAPARLLHVVEGIDFSWPRGWMASKSADRHDLIEPVCDLGRGVPCDLVYYDHPYLGDGWRGRLLMCRWDRHAVTAYRPQPRGASFTAIEETVLTGDDNCRPVGVAVGRGGELFVTCLYMTGNMAAPYCTSDLVVVARGEGRPDPATVALARGTIQPAQAVYTLDDARSDDLVRRQIAVRRLAATANIDELAGWATATDEATRLAGVLCLGQRLTVPAVDDVPPAALPLFYPRESSFFKREQRFWGSAEAVDLATLGRLGVYTMAERWKVTAHTPEQQSCLAALERALDDSSDRVRLQAAWFLSLLNDPRIEPRVAQARRDVQLRRLRAAPESAVGRAWRVGPFDDGPEGRFTTPHGPEHGTLDLTARYGDRSWQEARLPWASAGSAGPGASTYLHFGVQSGARQPGLLSLAGPRDARLWLNGALMTDAISAEGAGRGWIVDLQPGGNDVLLRVSSGRLDRLALRAAAAIEITLPDIVDSAQLAARLRAAAAAGAAVAVGSEFLAVDWPRAAATGDASEGRRLFGTLGCAKCHSIVPDQRSAGAPSLFEARRRFTVPHLVESVLVPSRQVAEPFRAQTILTDDGRTFTGLVVSENASSVELLLPDATRRTIAKPQIDERQPTQLSPMPAGLVKTPDELRHLLAYLLGDRPQPP